MNMEDCPRIIIGEPEHQDYSEQLNKIFQKITYDAPDGLIELRKEQILNHSKCNWIVDALEDIVNLIGQAADGRAESIMEFSNERLVLLHSPVYLTIPYNFEALHKWEDWCFEDLYDKYWDLAMSKGWIEDYYTIEDLSKDLSKGKYLDNVKNYHVLDMLNDLIVNDRIICGYEFKDFLMTDKLLEPFEYDCFTDNVIEVKLKEKFKSVDEYLKYLSGENDEHS